MTVTLTLTLALQLHDGGHLSIVRGLELLSTALHFANPALHRALHLGKCGRFIIYRNGVSIFDERVDPANCYVQFLSRCSHIVRSSIDASLWFEHFYEGMMV